MGALFNNSSYSPFGNCTFSNPRQIFTYPNIGTLEIVLLYLLCIGGFILLYFFLCHCALAGKLDWNTDPKTGEPSNTFKFRNPFAGNSRALFVKNIFPVKNVPFFERTTSPDIETEVIVSPK